MINLYEKAIKVSDLPNPFIPATSDFFNEQFYWDSFFIMTGLETENESGYRIAKGITENFSYLINKMGYIPNSHKSYNTRSQPPFFSSAIILVYNHYQDKGWLKKMYKSLKKEYNYWNKDIHKTEEPLLLKYNDIKEIQNGKIDLNYNAIQESGWDMTLRFENKCHEVASIDLNCLVYKMLKDLEFIAKKINQQKESNNWHKKSKILKEKINKFMFNDKENIYFDYNPKEKRQLKSKTLATFFPLFTKVATKNQAKKIVTQLKLFEKDYGLTTTTKELSKDGIQWGYPNGWAPLHYIAIYGLLNYGYKKEALRIARKYSKRIQELKKWPEKISVVSNQNTIDDYRYKHQTETFWTLGVYKNLKNLIEKSSN